MNYLIAALAAAIALASASPALAWGDKGHTIISTLGAKAIAAQSVPAFLKTSQAAFEIG
ncbi:MAG TPA: hypothetical protein VKT72_05540 [Candidatus Baltobacteraceae bacterium]|nr:hypothetical protein [Candidatus Baltobacteraceae bacterium]